jgi:hypothetical protein
MLVVEVNTVSGSFQVTYLSRTAYNTQYVIRVKLNSAESRVVIHSIVILYTVMRIAFTIANCLFSV